MREYYIYRFLDKNNNIIYIGKTKDIYKRINDHFGVKGHLPKDCYDTVERVEFATLYSYIDMNIYEMYLIDTIKPIYNTQFIFDEEESSLNLEELTFKPYDKIIKFYTDSRKRYVVSENSFSNNVYDITKDLKKYDKLRYKIISQNHNVVLNKRDFLVFKFIIEHQNCTASTISSKFFNDSLRACQRRLKMLCGISFISAARKDIISEKEYFISKDNLNIYKGIINKIS